MTDLRKAAEIALEALIGAEIHDPEAVQEAIQALRQALAQPEQEPVAWVYNGILHEFDPSEFATSEVKPLYTAPPKREWVGLTRQEAEDVVDDFITIGGDVENWVGYWQAIEAKLKEKNT